LKEKSEEYDSLQKEIKEKQKEHDKQLQKLRNGLEDNQQETVSGLRKSFEDEKKKMIEDFQVQAAVTKAKTDQRTAELRSDYEKLLRNKEQSSQASLSELKNALKNAQEELSQKVMQILTLKEESQEV
jgi:hypothetical protein